MWRHQQAGCEPAVASQALALPAQLGLLSKELSWVFSKILPRGSEGSLSPCQISSCVGMWERMFWQGRTGESFTWEAWWSRLQALPTEWWIWSLFHLSTVRPWAHHYAALPLMCVLCKSGYHYKYFLGYLWRLNEAIHIKYLAQCLAQSKHSVYGGLYYKQLWLLLMQCSFSKDLFTVSLYPALDYCHEQGIQSSWLSGVYILGRGTNNK